MLSTRSCCPTGCPARSGCEAELAATGDSTRGARARPPDVEVSIGSRPAAMGTRQNEPPRAPNAVGWPNVVPTDRTRRRVPGDDEMREGATVHRTPFVRWVGYHAIDYIKNRSTNVYV